jgi:hypothetical protein
MRVLSRVATWLLVPGVVALGLLHGCNRCEQSEQLVDGACVRTCNTSRECTGEEECADGICRPASGTVADGGAGQASSSRGANSSSVSTVSSVGASSQASSGVASGTSASVVSSSASSTAGSSAASSSAASSSMGSSAGSTASSASMPASLSSSAPGSSALPSSSAVVVASSSASLAGSSSTGAASSSGGTGPAVFAPVLNAPLDSPVDSNISPLVAAGGTTSCRVSGAGIPTYRACADPACSTLLLDWSTDPRAVPTPSYVQLNVQSSDVAFTGVDVTFSCDDVPTVWRVTTGAPRVEFMDAVTSLEDSQLYTFNNVQLGTPMASRLMVVAVHCATNSSTILSSLTVAGFMATKLASASENSGAGAPTALFGVRLANGSMGTITVDIQGASPVRCGISVFASYGLDAMVAYRIVEYEGTNPTTATLPVAQGGLVVAAMTMNNAAGATASWANLAPAYNIIMMEGSDTQMSGASQENLNASTAYSFGIASTSTSNTLRLLAVTFP